MDIGEFQQTAQVLITTYFKDVFEETYLHFFQFTISKPVIAMSEDRTAQNALLMEFVLANPVLMENNATLVRLVTKTILIVINVIPTILESSQIAQVCWSKISLVF